MQAVFTGGQNLHCKLRSVHIALWNDTHSLSHSVSTTSKRWCVTWVGWHPTAWPRRHRQCVISHPRQACCSAVSPVLQDTACRASVSWSSAECPRWYDTASAVDRPGRACTTAPNVLVKLHSSSVCSYWHTAIKTVSSKTYSAHQA